MVIKFIKMFASQKASQVQVRIIYLKASSGQIRRTGVESISYQKTQFMRQSHRKKKRLFSGSIRNLKCDDTP
jgi:hypothetical protein